MERRGIGHGSCLTVAIACALAALFEQRQQRQLGRQGQEGASRCSTRRNDAGAVADARRRTPAAPAAAATKGSAGRRPGHRPSSRNRPPSTTARSPVTRGHGYWFCAAETKREPARSLCRQLGGDFIVIDDAAENAFVADQIAADTYIGYSDADKEGKWVWVDGSKGGLRELGHEAARATTTSRTSRRANGRWKSTVDIALGFACEGAKLMKP